jgi:hypothetical protein
VPGALGRRALAPGRDGFYYASDRTLRRYTFGSRESEVVAPFPSSLTGIGVAPNEETIYAASAARLWRVDIGAGPRQQIPFAAHVEMETLVPAPADWEPQTGANVELRAVLSPTIAPDGRSLVFTAAGFLWQQTLDGGPARKLVDESSYQTAPAFSPDGREIVFVSDTFGRRELRVLDLETGRTRTIATVPGAAWASFPRWSADGQRIVFQRTDGISDPYRLLSVDAHGVEEPEELARTTGSWNARPQLSADGTSLYFTARTGVMANVFRLALHDGAEPEAVTDLSRHAHDAELSPDENWLAFRRNAEIWLAPVGGEVLADEDFRLFSEVGGRSFSFTPDSDAIVYSEGARIWRKPVGGARATEIPVRLGLTREIPAPLLISDVRVLDLIGEAFTEETSMLIEQGRISWIGPEAGHDIPRNLVRIDAGGRYAIPGIMDTHTHAAWSNQKVTDDSLIAYGVTSVRDTGSRLDVINSLLDRGEATSLPVPRYFHSGDIFEGLIPL